MWVRFLLLLLLVVTPVAAEFVMPGSKAHLNTRVNPFRVPGAKDFFFYRHVGSANGLTIWYAAGVTEEAAVVNTLTLGTGLQSNVISAIPFYSTRQGVIDVLAFRVATAASTAGSACRPAIYQAISDTNIYPGVRVYDAGSVDVTTTGVKQTNPAVTLSANTLYYFTIACNTSAGSVTRGIIAGFANANDMVDLFGFDTLMATTFTAIQNSYTCCATAPPATFLTGGALGGQTPIPFLAVHFSG